MTKVSDERRTDRELSDMIQSLLNHGEAGYTYVNIDAHLSALCELQSLRASIPGDVGVKGLDWTRRQRRLDEWKAHTSVGMYEVGEVHGRWSAVLRYVDSDCQAEDVVVGRFDSPDEAKAAAQADYERRVLSALDLSPAEQTALPERCPHCDLHWGYNPPAHVAGSNQVRCIECKTLYAAISDEMVERVLAWVREDVLPAYGITHATRASDPEMIEGLTAALSVKPQSGENG